MPNSDELEVTKPTTVGNDESKRWRGGKGSSVRVEERANWCYAEILNGGTRRQTEQIATRGELLNQIQALRLSACRKAMAKGQLQTVAMLLKDMGAVIGEAAPEQQAAAAPTLNITVEDKRQG